MRTLIPNRRHSEIVSFAHDGIAFKGSVSFLPDGRPVEIFLEAGKIGSAVQHSARDSAVAASLALQYGTPLEVLRAAMTRLDVNDEPAGPLGAFLDRVAQP